ncbi:hypothetical protein L332_01480 [Agrococcus pavilionensis RW1]|uniref:Glucose/Sorbosone dehydrogenase domain-containing protein n=1 Tax=Agrococcus pavilionensis RW1 TaxID=1330458 RepID=U1MR39_9MICO|nr:PQQ-dependent sugar dehydrogenase [Agrococcus pavilionensis]ERG63125.1 hypothetical protein L332_01480 [Agrococcus pavilionensis RW1]
MSPRRRRRVAAPPVALALVLALAACGPGEPTAERPAASTDPAPSGSPGSPDASASPSPRTGTLESPETLATELESPWSIALLPGGGALVSERDTARVVEVLPGGGTAAVAAIDGVVPRGEGGLLGIAVRDGRLYWYATRADGNAILRASLEGSPGERTLGEPEELLAGIPAAGNHNGGRIAFGPDGMLYATTGDAGVPARSQDPASLAGKILRLEPDGSVPADNPTPGSPVYTLGHRNPQGLAWSDDGTLLATEFGQDTWDELNVIEAGANYGWPLVEGAAGDRRFVDPVQQWPPAEASPSGIAVAGEALWIANLRGQSLRRVPLDDLASSSVHWQGEHGRLRDVAAAPDGSVWALTGSTDGRGRPSEGDDRILAFEP